MKKKPLVIFLVIMLIGTAGPVMGSLENDQEKISEEVNVSLDNDLDDLDQENTVWSGDGIEITSNHPLAQSFTPSYNKLSRLEILVEREDDRKFVNCQLVVFKYLESEYRWDIAPFEGDLVSFGAVPVNTPGWLEFDHLDVSVWPGFTYYIHVTAFPPITDGYGKVFWKNWPVPSEDFYPQGEPWEQVSVDPLEYQEITYGSDFCFRTYGYNVNNPHPPNDPIINGPTTVKLNEDYRPEISTTDPDGDDVYFEVEFYLSNSSNRSTGWSKTGWIGPRASGSGLATPVRHWENLSALVLPIQVRAQARDEYGAVSGWTTVQLTVSKEKSSITPMIFFFINHQPLVKFFQRFL